MFMSNDWWRNQRKITVVVDNDSWILPFAGDLVSMIQELGDNCSLARTHDEIAQGDIAFYLGCVKITPDDVLERNRLNLVVHESDLPKGKGFAPLFWQVIEGKSDITICLLEAASEVDSGNIYMRETLNLRGTELNSELRKLQGEITQKICLSFLKSEKMPEGEVQIGESSFYPRRRQKDSELDITKSIEEQFDLLRTVSNTEYPAFINHRGKKYLIKIEEALEP
jgi:methionyl-tRNA formyltransferase